MLEYLLKLNLQLFADGGDGGSTGEGAAGGEAGEINTDGIPDRAKERYRKAVAQHTSQGVVQNATQNPPSVQPTTEQPVNNTKQSYADLIKSDDYKDEHRAYMERTIGDRLKKYKGVEEQNSKMRSVLETVASKYNLDANNENFLEELSKKVDADNSYYEGYAVEHDITPEEARKIVTLERQVQSIKQQEQAQQKQEAMRNQLVTLHKNAERTKAQFPDFDLDKEMKDERFRRLCAVNQGDTTAAYMACHWNEIIPNAVQRASQQITAQTAQAVAANRARPQENGISGNASSVVEQDFSKMSLEQLRAYAEEQRRKQQGR